MNSAGIIAVFLAALIIPGIILRTKSIASGRKGPGMFQPYKDISVLLKKGSVFSTTSGSIFQIAPAINLATVLCAALFIPFGKYGALISFEGDFIFFSYLIALGRFFAIIAALDTGSSFEGMGANREAFFSMLLEPAFFILMASFAMATGFTSFTDIFSNFYLSENNFMLIFGLLGIFVFLQTAMVETCRLPVDDPKTHLELTMIHEVMILDNSGFDKALIHLGTYIKFALYGLLIFNLTIPPAWTFPVQLVSFVAIQVLLALAVGLIESFRARNKMNKNPKYILTISGVAWIAFIVILLLGERFLN